ncbi:WhiB family transcriptional regulator [Streptomyces sp. NPDC056632]|uniref:WhiB family transcriptional regulator n=1 Tax=Streptomyces sp. NPDC056632 TaxID=3345884 RepID=UPI00367B48BD
MAGPFLSRLGDAPLPCTSAPGLFHSPDARDDAPGDDRIRQAVALCRTCPVMLPCRQWARAEREFGVWGAETDAERAAWRHENSIVRLPPPRPRCGTAAGAKWERRHSAGGPCWSCARAESEAGGHYQERQVEASRSGPPRLSPRERAVLGQLAAGLDRRAARARLALSTQAMSRAMGGLRAKLRTDDAGIVRAAREAGVLPGRV